MRLPRVHQIVPNHPHHVFIRGNNRRRLFSYPRDFEKMLRLLRQAQAKFKCKVNRYCLMTNHNHFQIVPPSVAALSTMMKNVLQRYARYRNTRTGGSGKLFEARFHCKPILTLKQLIATEVYIDLNPVEAGIVERPEDYRWTSYRMYAGLPEFSANSGAGRNLVTLSDYYLSLSNDPARRSIIYRDLVSSRIGKASEIASDFPSFNELEDDFRRLERPNGERAR